jgi:hypothetical protein
MLEQMAFAVAEAPVGDKSPKSKEKGQKQKSAATSKVAAMAQSKQDAYSQTARNTAKIPPKGKR